MIRTILFDLDGTLIDTEPSAAKAIAEGFASWGIQSDPADAHYLTGRTWQSAFDYYFKKYRVPIPHDQAADILLKRYRAELERELHVVPGSVDAVKALAPHFDLALVSGSYRSEILWALAKLGIKKHFKVIYGAEDYSRSKPAPDGYLKAMETLKADGPSTVVFEDSEPGIASGRSVGAWVVAITATNHFNHDTSFAHAKIPDLRGVDAKWIQELGRKLTGSK
jgi:HAD superfamily hydrolase (TIGR01509 family)